MKNWKINYKILTHLLISFIFVSLFTKSLFSNELIYEIRGNNFTDSNVILSLLSKIPDEVNEEYTNDIIKNLNKSNLFSDVNVKIEKNKYIINVVEFPSINKVYFEGNKRFKDEELNTIATQIKLFNFNQNSIELFIKEITNLYESFGYNNTQINYTTKLFKEKNTIDINFNISEGDITKISNIFINGNKSFLAEEIKQKLNSKTKSIRNIFANNNFKPYVVEQDIFQIIKFYKNNGFLDVNVENKVEYLKSNKVNLYFNIEEGNIYTLSSINIEDKENLLKSDVLGKINLELEKYLLDENTSFSIENIQQIRDKITSIIFDNDIEFIEITTSDKIEDNKISILFNVNSISPKYTKQINIVGNNRTLDYVIRRELDIVEGDVLYNSQIDKIRQKLISLNLFKSVKIKEEKIDNNLVNLIIEIEEKQTGSFNIGVSVGTLDGFSVVTGLRERNFYGTGRSLDFLINTSEDKNEFKLITTDRLSIQNNADLSYKINYKQQDLSKSSSYKLDTFTTGIGIGYLLNENLFHKIDFEYVFKDYKITNRSTASNSILNSSGGNMSYLIKNNIKYSTLNPGFLSKKGRFFNFNNTIETPTSSSNGFVRNLITVKQYYNMKKNIFSIQSKIGNIFSLNNNDILTDDKFALGGRWLRGFDNYGAGPRNSRTSYVGGNNIAVTKFDYSYELTNNSNFPIFINLFNDYGLIWDNKTKPTNSDNNLRSSAGFGIKYYSPIGPIGFTWGFPIIDEEYDIKRMFLFSIGNID